MPEMSHLDKYKFRRDLEEIEKADGRGTELVSVYVPPDKLISDVANYLRGEYSQSSNIKSQSTRKHVQGAIESILQRLKYYKEAPPNGLVFFTGHKAIGADQTSMVAYVLEPPEPAPGLAQQIVDRFSAHSAPGRRAYGVHAVPATQRPLAAVSTATTAIASAAPNASATKPLTSAPATNPKSRQNR